MSDRPLSDDDVPAVILPGNYTYRTYSTSMWFRADGSPVSSSEHIELDRRMNALLRRQMEPGA